MPANYIKSLYLILALAPCFLFGQNISISGVVRSTEGVPLEQAEIYVNDSLCGLSNTNGFYVVSIPFNTDIYVGVYTLGYRGLQKEFHPVLEDLNLIIDFELEVEAFRLEQVEIVTKAVNLFSKTDWYIYDFLIHEHKLFVLGREFPDYFLYIFDLTGKLVLKKPLDYKFDLLHKSCLGGLHLAGKEFCRQVNIGPDSIALGEPYAREKFDGLILPCKIVYKSIPIFESRTAYNQVKKYYSFTKNHHIYDILTVSNQDNIHYAEDIYKEIMQEYLREINKRKTSSVEYVDNKFENPSWAGSLDDLSITSKLMLKISMFKGTVSRSIAAEIFQQDSLLYVIDLENKILYNIDPVLNKSAHNKIMLETCKKSEFFPNEGYGDAYVLCSRKKLFKIKIDGIQAAIESV
jgi:hypothetical protein